MQPTSRFPIQVNNIPHYQSCDYQFMQTFSHTESIPQINKPKINTNQANRETHPNIKELTNSHQEIYKLEPWRQSNHEITEYHKMQEQIKLKVKLNRKISCVQTSRFDRHRNCKAGADSKCANYSTQVGIHAKDQNGRAGWNCQCKATENQFSFYTISTSNEQRLKWQLQMEVMMKRRKRISNMLKIRHFGYLKQNYFPNKKQFNKTDTNQSKSQVKLEKWSKMLQIVEDDHMENNLTSVSKIKSQRSVTNGKDKTQAHQISLSNLYSVLKTYTHRSEVKKRMSHNFTKNKSRSQSETKHNSLQTSSIKIETADHNPVNSINSQVGTQLQNQKTHKHFKTSKMGLKDRFSECLTNRCNKNRQILGLDDSIRSSQSVNLSKKSYAGHSIKNKLRLLKSKNKIQKSKGNNHGVKTG